jgi:hypothetical protein
MSDVLVQVIAVSESDSPMLWNGESERASEKERERQKKRESELAQ